MKGIVKVTTNIWLPTGLVSYTTKERKGNDVISTAHKLARYNYPQAILITIKQK